MRRDRIITYLALILWLIARQANAVVVLVGTGFVSPQSDMRNRLDNWNLSLYGLLLLGSFAVITLVIALNRDDLKRLNIDWLFLLIFLVCGAIGLYFLPYNCFSVIAVGYLVYAFLTRKIHFAVGDPRPSWIGPLAIPVLVVAVLVVGSILGWSKIQQHIGFFLLEEVPIAVSEEAVYRGMLYMLLQDWNVGEFKIIFIQAFLFWIAHIDYVLQVPLFFWIVVPILGLVLGYVAFRLKSVGLSSILHIGFNFITVFTSLSS